MKRSFICMAPVLAAAILMTETTPASHTVVAAGVASLGGSVKLDGPAPKRTPINMAKEPTCAALHGSSPVLTEDVVTDSAGDLQNVVVYVSSGLPDSDPAPPQEPVVINQEGCSYKPHVIAMQAGQKLQIVNSDKTSHNIHPIPETNREWNKSQPAGAPAFEEVFGRAEVGIPVKCNVHAWMRAYISVFRHPFFAVTNQSGGFAIKNLPPGKYTVSAWHEKLGTVSQNIVVGAGEAKTLQFAFKPRPGA